ncbi:ankyrin repeat domain-containing protein [Wolbachia endosymbiont (group A) of Pherbina coryleti]|uniref:ankyrin repeat domain-containing protein n=1 Tax=Wolbachia endosymbiont (group A) of Pherbina coryleti TaxID=3066153 RepID=UPI003132B768
MLRVEQHKGFGNDLQPSSSFQVSGRQQSNDYDKVNSNLEEFVKYFVKEFEAKLHAYHMILEGEVKKAGKFSDTFSRKVGKGTGGVIGGGFGLLLVPFMGSAALRAGVTGGAALGEGVGGALGGKLGEEHHRKKVISLSELVYYSKKNKANVRRMLVEAGFDIFQSFEMQFMRVTTDQGHEGAMRKLAEDATNRAISYYMQKEDALITEGVVLGESKIEPVLGVPIATSKTKTPGFKVNYKYKSSEKEWVTASLYEKVGLVLEKKSPSYYEKKDGKSRTDKYGYRRLFTSEDWNKLENECRLSDVVKSGQFTDYQYILNLENLKSKVTNILEKINSDDKDLTEERVRKVLEEVKDDIIKEINTLKEQSHEYTEDHKILKDIEANLKDLKVDEYLKKFKQYFEEAKQERQKIAKSIEASREESRENFNQLSQKQDIHHDDNKREHKKTQEGIDELKVEQGEMQDKIEKLSKKIAGASNQQVKDREPVWFGVEDLVRPFIALTPGRQEKLEQIASSIQEGVVVISGLRGVGKTELAIQFARGKYSENEQGSAILIDAKDAENSFRILAKDKLKISCKDIDGGEKTINSMVDDVYDYFSNKRSLFIFDNAQRYIDIKKFLPLRLPPGASKPLVLITSDNLNKLEWPSSKVKIEELDKFQESESIKFIKTSLGVSDDSQGKSIKDLANKLYHFPLLLEYAVRDIKRYQEGNQNFKISNYNSIIDEYIERLNLGPTPHNDVLAELLRIRLDQIRQEEYGERALKIAHVMAYCASQNLPKGIFSNLDDEIGLLQQYSILKQGSINMHELVQQIVRSELQNQPLEEETLKQALNLFKDYMKESDSVEHYKPHIVSVWNYASKHDKLIENFITNANYNESDFTTYLHLIVEKSSNDVAGKVLNSISHDKLEQIINVKKKDQKTLLHCAALGGNKSIVRLLINKEASIDARDQIGNTPLHLAAKKGYLGVVNILLDSEAKVNSETQQKFTPLHLAAKENHLDIINALLAKKANINAQTKQKFTPLHFAAQNGHLEVVNALLDKGAKVENFDVEYKITPLHLAAEGDHIEVIKALLGKKGKADINAKTPKKTPLMWAARKGRVKAVRELLRREADIVFKNDKGETALNLAAKGDHWETALVLFNRGARLDELSLDQYLSFVCFHLPEDKFETEYRKLYSDKDKPIHYDQRRNKFYYKDGGGKVYMEESKINLKKRKNLYLDVLSKIKDSIQKGNTNKFQKFAELISKIGEIEKKDSHKNVFLSFYQDNSNSIKDTNLVILACEYNNLEALKYLFDGQNKILSSLSNDIKKDVNPDDMDSKGHNAFYYAIRSGNVELLNTLINKWQGNYFNNPTKLQELDDLLSKAYDELKLKNVPLSEGIEVFIQDKLINLRFFSERSDSRSVNESQTLLDNIKKRIDIVIEGINSLGQEYSGTKEVDGKFLYTSTFIVKNIRILKRQLPFTYDKLPWEEIEFSLTSFVSSYTKDQEINFVFKTILDKQKLLDYLSIFKDTLSEKKDTLRDQDLDRELPSTQRRNIIDNIICCNPTFSGLYDDYEQMRDIYSLKQIEHYINIVLSDNIEGEIKQHVIERALQVTGEYLKSTLTSPNMSSTLSELIIQSVSESTSKILTSLRDSLSHSYSLASRMKIAASRSPEFLSNVQNDLKKIGEKIIDIFYKNKVEAISTLLSKIANSNSLDEMKKIAKVLEDVQFDEINLEKIKIKEHENVKRLIGDLNNCIKDKTDYQKELFDKISEILKLEESKLTNAKVEYLNKLYTLEEVVSMVRSGNIKTMKTLVQRDLKNFLKRDQDKQEKIADLVVRIANSKTHSSLVNELVYNVFYTDQFALGSTSLIEEFHEKLKREGNKGTRRATIEEKQAKLDGIFGKILREKLNLQEDKVVEIIKELKNKGREDQEQFSATKEKLLLILNELASEESQGEEEIKSKIRARYKEEGYESSIDKSGLERQEKEMLKGSLTKTKKLGQLIKRKENIKHLCEKITDSNIQSKITDIFEALITEGEKNKGRVGQKAKEKREEFEGLLDELKKGNKALIAGDYESNNWNSGKDRIENLDSEYEEFLGLIDHINQDSINKVSQLFNKFSRSLTMESNQKENLNKSFKGEIEENLKSSSVISQKLSELESILDENELNSKLIEKFSSYKVNRKLQAIVEMLVLDITEVLNAKRLLTENRYFLDKTSSILIGKQLRNYLAHGDPLINALSFDTLMSIISNARTFVEKKDITIGGKKLIGQVIEDDPFSLEEQHKQNLEILNIQKKMFSAAEEGNIDEVKDCIRKGADVNARDINGWNALHYAARGDKINVTKFFLGQNLSIDTKNNKGETPLHIAACFGSKGIIGFFVKYKDLDVNHLLCLAAGNGYKEIVDILLSKKGADVNKPTDMGGVSLHFAAENGHKDVVNALLKVNGIEVNTKTTDKGWMPLHYAAQNGHKDVVDALLEVDGIEVNAKTTDEDVPLHLAAQNGHKGVVDALLKVNGIEVNAKNDMHWTPLHLAAQNGHKDVVDDLLEVNGIEVNETTDEDVTPLHLAAQNGHKDVVDALLEVDGIEVNAKTTDTGWTPLHLAAQNGHKDVVDALLEVNGIEVNAQTTDNTNKGATPLHLAAQNGHKDVVDSLLKVNGIEVNETTDKGITPLHVAAQIGHKDVVDALLEVDGIEVNAKTTDKGMTPLHVAAQSGHKNVVDSLLEVDGIEVNAKTTDKGRTPLHLAAQNGHKDVVDALLKVDGIEINVKTTDENVTPLHLAAQNGHKDVVDSLLKAKGIEVNARTTDTGWTPLHLAAQNGHKDVVNALLKVTDIEVNAKGDTHWTPLHVAAQSGHRDVVDALLKVDGIEINVKTTGENVTPLHLAAQNGRKDVVDSLLKAKDIEVNAKDKNKCTPLHYAAQNGHKNVVDSLLKAEGIEVNAKTTDKSWIPLHYAAQNGHKDVVDDLLEVDGIEVNAKGTTPLHLTQSGENDLINSLAHIFEVEGIGANVKEKMKMDFLNKVNANINTDKSWTPLHLAVHNGHKEVVEAILNKKADIFARNDCGTVLYLAVVSNNIELIRFILDIIKEKDPQNFSKHIDAEDAEGDTPLMWAVHGQKVNATKVLLEYGANVNAQNSRGESALHRAAKGDYQEFVQLLLERQADPNIQDNNGKAPLDLVQEGLDKNPENKDLEKIKNLLSDTMNELSNQSKDKQDPSSMLTESVVYIPYSRGSSK